MSQNYLPWDPYFGSSMAMFENLSPHDEFDAMLNEALPPATARQLEQYHARAADHRDARPSRASSNVGHCGTGSHAGPGRPGVNPGHGEGTPGEFPNLKDHPDQQAA